MHGRMRLGAACKAENVSIDSSGGKRKVFRLRKTVISQKNSYIKIISFINICTFKLLSIDISGPVSRHATAKGENVMLGRCPSAVRYSATAFNRPSSDQQATHTLGPLLLRYISILAWVTCVFRFCTF
jgi:hypothetical protein